MNDEEQFLIQAIGSFSSGKSRLVSSIGLSYGIRFFPEEFYHKSPDKKCMVVGSYVLRKSDMVYSGGFDAVTMTSKHRSRVIEDMCNSEYKIVAHEGTLSTIYKKHFDWFDNLPRKKLIIFLDVSIDELKDRITIRGKKPMSEKRETHLQEKYHANKQFLDHAKEVGHKIIETEFVNDEHHLYVLKQVEKITGAKMKEYILKQKVGTLWRFA